MPGSTVPTSGANQGRNVTAAPHSATPQNASEDATTVGRTILSEDEIRRALTRIAYEIIETNKGVENLVLIGIRSRGVPLAVRLAARIQAIEPNFNAETRLGALDITAYRDDQPTGGTTSPENAGESIMPAIGIEGKTVVLVDDVLYSGRTVYYPTVWHGALALAPGGPVPVSTAGVLALTAVAWPLSLLGLLARASG